ncbi:MAG: helix-turn-helix transcriptional regulator [Pseudomonadota bacterium]
MKISFLNIHDMVLILTLAECLFLALLLKLIPTKRTQSHQLLAFFFISVALWILATLLIWNVDLQALSLNHSVLTPLLLASTLLLQGPILYFYLRSLSEDIYLLHWHNFAHLVPLLVAAFTIIIFDIDGKDWLPWSVLSPIDKLAMKFVWALVHCLPLIYVLACFYVEYQSRKNLKQMYSSISSLELQLADLILLGFFLHWLWSFVEYFAGIYLSSVVNDWMGIANNYLIVLQVNGLFVFGLMNTRQLIDFHIQPLKMSNTQKINILDEEKIRIIENAIHQQKIYLESNINLERFAECIDMKPRDLSIIINTHYKLNFFEFINSLRIEEAKYLLSSPEHIQDTVLEIIHKSGFNSQSSFQRFFKRLVGVTPTEYRKQKFSINNSG